ncbi:multidrug effflux MFS transporter [Comamonas sp. NoAH]|uniref:multidrug effflux MFS transporter n=1 Tax=Comamonas halotolerans TaxID=3041496 RepID=UPI0024E0C6B5|nr:multidrug effflux MFS transporter [Comamonas sp. NoAH]
MSPLFVIGLLALLLGFQPLTTDLYLPAMPLLAQQLQATVAQTQTTFYALILAFGCSQLVWGPMSDRWGRRPILLAGIGLYALAALGCAVAPHMDALIAFRTFQGVAMGAVVMAARAIVRDLYQPVEGAHVMSKALSGLGALACCSPLIGSWLAIHMGWRATMVALTLIGMAAWWLVWQHFHESLQHRNPHALHPRRLLASWRDIGRHRTFLAYTATTTCSYSGLVVFLTAAPFVFTQALDWTAAQVGWMLACNGAVYILGTMLCRRLLLRLGVRNTVAIAGGIAVLCATLLLTLACAGVQSGLSYAAVCMLFPLAHGIQQPCGQSGSVSAFPQAAGMASALNGFVMTLFAFASGRILGGSFNGTVYPLVFGLTFWCLAAALASWTLVRRHGAPSAH